MDYKISNICSDLGIGKSTVYKRINALKQSIPDIDCKKNKYFYYTDNNKLFITELGFNYIKDFELNKNTNNVKSNYSVDVVMYQNEVIEMYKQRIDYLENENSRLLDIISFKEQKEITKEIKSLNSDTTINSSSFFSKIFSRFKLNNEK